MSVSEEKSIYQHRVSDVVTRDVVALVLGDSVHDALNVMCDNRVSAMPVVDGHDRCVGILSIADLIDMVREIDDDLYYLDHIDSTSRRFLLDKLAATMGHEKVVDFMTEAVTTVSLDTSIGQVTREMLRNRVHHLPVVHENGKLAGIVSTMDVLAEFADAAP